MRKTVHFRHKPARSRGGRTRVRRVSPRIKWRRARACGQAQMRSRRGHGDDCLTTSGARLESSRAEKCAAWSQWARGSSAREAPRRRSTGRCQILSLLIAAGRLPSRRQRSMRPREQDVTWHGGWWPSSEASTDFRRPQPRSVRADGALESSEGKSGEKRRKEHGSWSSCTCCS